MQESLLFQGCGFSLWYLEPSLRRNWLMAALVIFYKYNFNRNAILGEKATGIVRIVLHTLANQAHECDRYRKATQGQSVRSRDLSQLSIGESQSEKEAAAVIQGDHGGAGGAGGGGRGSGAGGRGSLIGGQLDEEEGITVAAVAVVVVLFTFGL